MTRSLPLLSVLLLAGCASRHPQPGADALPVRAGIAAARASTEASLLDAKTIRTLSVRSTTAVEAADAASARVGVELSEIDAKAVKIIRTLRARRGGS